MEEIETTAKLKITIKWENFYGYLQLLRKQKSSEKKSQDEILKISNYFLISPEHIFKIDNSNYYLETLFILSRKYYEKQNIFGIHWVYNAMKKLGSIENNEKFENTKRSIIYYYADLLNQKKQNLNYAKELLNELGNFDSCNEKIQSEFTKLKESINNNLQNSSVKKCNDPPFNWIDHEDVWNPYIETYAKLKNENIIEAIDRPNKIKVLLLLKNHEIDIPIIPRDIYFLHERDLNELLTKLNCSTEQEQPHIVKIPKNQPEEDLLYLIHFFIEENHLLYKDQQTTIEDFISSQDKEDYILIISLNKLELHPKTDHYSIPQGLQHFIDFQPILTKILESTYSYESTPLRNLGSTCYFNAGLQSIMHCNKLSEYFQTNEYNKYYMNDEKSIVKEYINFLNDTLKIENFVNKFILHEPKYKRYEQHDSPELIADVLNYFGSVTNRAHYEIHNPNMFEHKNEKSFAQFLKTESSIISDLFYGQVQHTFSCTCERALKFEEFMLLDVPIPGFPIKFQLFYEGKLEAEEATINYYQLSDLTGQYVRTKINETLKINVDILCIDHSKSEVTLINDKDRLFYVNMFVFNKEEKNKNLEIVLYEKKDPKKKTFYIVPCQYCNDFNWKFSTLHQTIMNYPIQISLDNNNTDKTKFTEVFKEYKNVNSQIYGVKNTYNINNTNFISDIKNESILYFKNESHDISWKKRENVQCELTKAKFNECIEAFKKGQSKVKCSKCGEYKSLETEFSMFPHYLVIYFKRFFLDIETKNFKKNDRFIEIQESIELTDIFNKTHKYKAFSMIIHKGSVSRGHYIAHCKEKNKWYEFNDKKVKTEIKFNPNENVLVVFYEKQK